MRKLKVWGRRYLVGRKCGRRIVAAYTKKQAVELAGISMSEMNNYWSETGNAMELSIAREVGVWDTVSDIPNKIDTYFRVK